MATGDARISVVVEATDNATRPLQNVRRELDQLGTASRTVDQVTSSVTRASGGMAEWERTVGSLRSQISGLTPALGEVGTAAESALARTSALSAGWVGLIVVAGDLAAAIGGKVVEAYTKAAQAQRDFQAAASTSDLSGLNRQIDDQVRKLRDLAEARQKLAEGAFTPTGLLFPGLDTLSKSIAEGRLLSQTEDKRKEIEARQREFERIQLGNAFAKSEADADQLARDREARRFDLTKQQRGLFDFRLDPADALLAQAGRQAYDLRLDDQRDAAGNLLGAAAAQRQFDLRRRFRFPDYAVDFDESLAFRPSLDPAELSRLETVAQLRRLQRPDYIRQRDEDLRRAQEAGDESQAFAARLSPRQQENLTRGAAAGLLQLDRERLDVDRERIEVLSRAPALTEQERDALQETVTRQRELLELKRLEAEIDKQQRLVDDPAVATDADKQRLQNLRELLELKRQGIALDVEARQRALAERYDPVAGAVRGLQDFEDMAARQGERFRVALFGSLQNVSAGITDILVAGLSGDIDKIGDIGKQMGQALLRGLIQELVVTPLVSTLSATLRGAIGSVFGGGTGLGTATAGAGGGLLALLGLGGASQAGAAVGTAPNLPVGSIVQTVAGTGVVTASGTVVLAGGSATVGALQGSGGDLVAAAGAGASPFGGAVSAVPTSSQAAVAGTSLTSAVVGGFAGAAAVGLTAYSASQYAKTTQDVAFAGVTGAVAGAAAGASIGGYFDSSGYGALIGAVAGAAISAGAAVYGKRNNQPKKAEREQQEVSGVAASFQPMFGELDAAQTPEELYAVVKRYTHQGAGGERSGRGAENAGLVSTVDLGGTRVRVIGGATADQLVARGDTVQVELIVGVAPEVKKPFEDRLAQAIQQAAARIRALGEQVRIFTTRHLRGGISETTVLGLSRLAELVGKDLSVVVGTLDGLDPEARDKILARIAAADIDGAAQLYAVESNLQAKVRIGEVLTARLLTPDATSGGTDIPGLLDDATSLGPDQIEQLFRDSMMNPSPGGDEGGAPDGSGSTGPSVTGVSFDGPNINVTLSDNTTVTVTPSEPSGLAGQGLAGALSAMGVPAGIANAIGTGLDIGIGFAGPQGGFLGLLNTIGGKISSAARGKKSGVIALPKVTITGPKTSGPDPDPEGGVDMGEPPGIPEGTVTVGPVSFTDDNGNTVSFDANGNVTTTDSQGNVVGNTSDTGTGGGGGGTSGGGGTGGGATGAGGGDAMAEGGWVPGDRRRGDVVPALVGAHAIRLQGEEFVVNPASAAEHAPELEEINRRKPGRWPEPKVASTSRPEGAVRGLGQSKASLRELLFSLVRMDKDLGLGLFNNNAGPRSASTTF